MRVPGGGGDEDLVEVVRGGGEEEVEQAGEEQVGQEAGQRRAARPAHPPHHHLLTKGRGGHTSFNFTPTHMEKAVESKERAYTRRGIVSGDDGSGKYLVWFGSYMRDSKQRETLRALRPLCKDVFKGRRETSHFPSCLKHPWVQRGHESSPNKPIRPVEADSIVSKTPQPVLGSSHDGVPFKIK